MQTDTDTDTKAAKDTDIGRRGPSRNRSLNAPRPSLKVIRSSSGVIECSAQDTDTRTHSRVDR